MADNFDFLGAREDIEFLGGTQTRPVVSVSIRTKPHGTYMEFRIPRKQYNAHVLHSDGLGFAGTVEGVWALPGVVGMQYVQVPTSGGELQDAFTVTVESTSGDSTVDMQVPYGELADTLLRPKVKAQRSLLDAAEAV